MNTFLKKQQGLSLVEILVALVISLFLLGGIVQVYIGNKTAYRFSDATSRIQENGRFALDSISTDSRMAGFWGCISFQGDRDGDGQFSDDNPDIQNHLNPASGNYNANRHDFIDQPAITATVNDGLNGSDSLSLRGAKPGQSVFVANLTQPGSGSIQVSANNSFQTNDIILITNCYTADIFEASGINTNAGVTTISHNVNAPANTPGNTNLNTCAGVGTHCLLDKNDAPFTPQNAAAFSLQTVTYSIQPSGSGNGEPSLWRSVNNNDEELIEGIEQMQVLFGVDTDADGTPNQYLTSDNVANLNQVTALRVSLVVRSENDGVLDDNQTYTFNGQNINAPDRRLRQVFSSTIALRNRAG